MYKNLLSILMFTFILTNVFADAYWQNLTDNAKSLFLQKNYLSALTYSQKALIYSETKLSNNPTYYEDSLYWMAHTNYYLKKYEDAEFFYRKLIKQKIKSKGKNHPDVQKNIKSLISLCHEIKQPEKAKDLIKLLN